MKLIFSGDIDIPSDAQTDKQSQILLSPLFSGYFI